MKAELKFLNSELLKLKLPVVKRDRRVYKTWNKSAYASCIAKARLQLLDVDNNWIEKRKTEIWEQNDMHRMGKQRVFKEKVRSELENDFFCLRGTQNYKDCRDADESHYYCFSNEDNNTMHENMGAENDTDVIIFNDDSENDDDIDMQPSQNQGNNRMSFGGTKLMGDLGIPF